MLPKNIGRYEVLGKLATGGMAEILLARLSAFADFNRPVVVKRILPQYAAMPSFVTMFLDEARTIAKIRHPNVVQVQELGQEESGPFLVLEYVAGENLSSVLKRSVASDDKLDAPLVAWIVAEACAGLHAAHEIVKDDGTSQNLVHRDVSPQNLFVAYDGHVKLLDFGVAITEERMARTEAGDVKGKFEYMSPEHARGEPLDRRSDIFAMGIVLYELGTGRRLFKRASPARTIDAICREPILPPSRLAEGFSPALEAICMRALAKKPEDRYATAAEMRLALLDVARDVTSPVEALADRMRRWFPDRIAEKEEMLRRVRAGDELSQVPSGEVDEKVRVPGVPEVSRAPRGGPPLAFAFALALAALVVVVGAVLVTRLRRTPPLTDAPAASAPAAPAEARSPSSPGASEILVHVESRPSGVRVLTDGRDHGATPLDLRLPRGKSPVTLELRRSGFVPASQVIVPDTDQKLLLSLQPATRPRAQTTPPKGTPATSASGFRRFE